jgi:hypothetical protein
MAVVLGTNSGFIALTAPTADPAGSSSLDWDGNLFAQRFTTGAFPIVVSQIGWYQDQATHGAAAWECAIYTNNATPAPDEPGTVVGSISTGWSIAADARGWQTATGLSISLAANTTYWIGIGIAGATGSISLDYNATGGDLSGYTVDAAGTLDSTWTGTFTNAGADRLWGVYALRGLVELVRYIDTDVVGGTGDGTSWANAFASMSAWEAAGDDAGNLVLDNTWMHVYARGNTKDTTVLGISGWTTSATNRILVEGSSDSTGKHAGEWDDGKYTLAGTNAASGILQANEDFVQIVGIQIEATESGLSTAYGLWVASISTAASDIRFKNIIVKGVCSGTGKAIGAYINDADADVIFENCLIYGFFASGDADFVGLRVNAGGDINVYSSLIAGCHTGVDRVAGTVSLYNTAVFNNTNDFNGTIACDYCASDDADATTYTNGVDFTGESADWENIWEDYTNDHRLKNYTGARCIIDEGTSKTYGDPDVAGVSRGATWDIGPFEWVMSGTLYQRAVAGAIDWGGGSAKRKCTAKRRELGAI